MSFTKITNTGIGSTGTVLLQNLDVIGIATAGFGVSTVDVFTTGITTFANETDSTSITTGSVIVSGGVGIAGSLNVGGSVSVGGTLTYEDVANVDSVGVITARAGVVVGSGITLSKDGDVFFTGVATGNGSGLTNLPAANLTGTLPAISGANLTNLDASDLASGTVPDARFPATLPAVSGANLTNIDSGMFIKTSAGIHTIGAQSNVGIGTTNPASGLDISLKTDGIALPEGTTSQRPSGSQKFIRFNSTTGSLELYNGNQWVEILSDYSQTGSTALG